MKIVNYENGNITQKRNPKSFQMFMNYKETIPQKNTETQVKQTINYTDQFIVTLSVLLAKRRRLSYSYKTYASLLGCCEKTIQRAIAFLRNDPRFKIGVAYRRPKSRFYYTINIALSDAGKKLQELNVHGMNIKLKEDVIRYKKLLTYKCLGLLLSTMNGFEATPKALPFPFLQKKLNSTKEATASNDTRKNLQSGLYKKIITGKQYKGYRPNHWDRLTQEYQRKRIQDAQQAAHVYAAQLRQKETPQPPATLTQEQAQQWLKGYLNKDTLKVSMFSNKTHEPRIQIKLGLP